MIILLYNPKSKEIKTITKLEHLINYFKQGFQIPNKQNIEEIKQIIKTKKDDYQYSVNKAIEVWQNENPREYISTNINVIPLYNIENNEIFPVPEDEIYHLVTQKHFRFPDKDLLKHNTKYLNLLSSFDLNILLDKYKDAIYRSITDNLTICRDSSLIRKKTEPYFSKDKLIKLALNYNIISKPDQKNPEELCHLINDTVITEMIILKHAEYIRTSKERHIIRFYSMDGDYYMNKYLRNLNKRQHKNHILENQVSLLWNLIRSSPSLKKDHIVYRFIDSDLHLQHLKPGDLHQVKGFMSTTRNPFYESDEYQFGDIVLKIHLPARMKGVGLLVELQSDFEDEQEVLLAPSTTLKLIKINFPFYHTNPSIENKIRKTYEFKVIKTSPIKFTEIYVEPTKNPTLILEQVKLKGEILRERINDFQTKYISSIQQFNVVINQHKYTFYIRIYDSGDIYASHYYYKTSNGFSINYHDPKTGQKSILIEIADIMVVNYNLENTIDIPDLDFLKLLADLANCFQIEKVNIFSLKVACSRFDDLSKLSLFERYTTETKYYNDAIYNYLKFNKIKYPEISNNINTTGLNKLHQIKIPSSYHLTSIYKKFKQKDNLKNFYIYLIEKDCKNIDVHHIKLSKYMEKKGFDKTFTNIIYRMNPREFLMKYNKI